MQPVGNRAAQHSHHELLLLFLLLANCFVRTIARMMAITATTPRVMKKQIHRFLRAARADSTALSVYCRLRKTIIRSQCVRDEVIMTYPASVSFSTPAACA